MQVDEGFTVKFTVNELIRWDLVSKLCGGASAVVFSVSL